MPNSASTTAAFANPVVHAPPVVQMPAQLYSRLQRRARELNAAGLKAYGMLVGHPSDPAFPYRAVDMVVLDSHRNRRNEPGNRAAFHAQGSYFRAFEDSGSNQSPPSTSTAGSRPTSPASTIGCTARLSPGI